MVFRTNLLNVYSSQVKIISTEPVNNVKIFILLNDGPIMLRKSAIGGQYGKCGLNVPKRIS